MPKRPPVEYKGGTGPLPITVLATRPYMETSSAFRLWVQDQRKTAQRSVDDLDAEIDRLRAEIEARLNHRSESAEIVLRCDAALTLDLTPRSGGRMAPEITERKETE